MDALMIEKATNAIADKNRLAILMEVARKGNCFCGDITELTGLSQPTISHHVKILVDAGVLIYDKTGRTVQLTINREMMKHLSMFFLKLS
ncbi:winged helix-turn-helix transcriptional regulator [Chitinophaga agrisoli]|uniref:Winged helix-turn-helix transcriptional regulator n=1 Tax=Chitinophaga agrisoli TaxID=2607653 RepID=A0A5B2VKG5_9BACT|nr:metalloregulator ArsR/SmtB family transcription factor [Chitinophaga agrisoli]KAA2239485.1 winged helix-turn-helix transcriptional regulator [Chitinophaga agrisoli]